MNNHPRPFNYPPPAQNYSVGYDYNTHPQQRIPQYQYNPQLYQPQPPEQQRQHVYSIHQPVQAQQVPYTAQHAPRQQQQQQQRYNPSPAQAQVPSQQPVQQQQPQQHHQQQHVRDSLSASPEVQAIPGSAQANAEAELERQLMDALNEEDTPQQNDVTNLAQEYPNQGTDEDPVYNLPPPPEATFSSFEAMEKSMHDWTLMHGYELVKRACKVNANGVIFKRYWDCSKHGKKRVRNRNPAGPLRKAKKSTLTDCPMSLATVAVDPSDPSGEWQIRHRRSHHNHPAEDAKALVGHRRRFRDENVQKALDGLFQLGTSTSQVMQFLKKTSPNGLFTRSDVANLKLKWKKYGTCVVKRGEGAEVLAKNLPRPSTPIGSCRRCRAKHAACDSVQPSCTNCSCVGEACIYDGRSLPGRKKTSALPNPFVEQSNQDVTMSAPTPLPAPQPQRPQQQRTPLQNLPATMPEQAVMVPELRGGRMSQSKKDATIQILEQLQSAQKERYAPRRLELSSSEVEVLAHSSCGDGSTYDKISLLSSPNEWPNWKEAVIAAAMKENTHKVLTGEQGEPQKPTIAAGQEGRPPEVETWNEWIKQLAIYKRRNEMLLAALRSHMAQNYRTRVTNFTKASDVWAALENLFQPRGCEVAFKLFTDLHSITLASSNNLNDYIHRMQSTYEKFRQLPVNTTPAYLTAPSAIKDIRPKNGGEAVPEEMVCMLFLQNLGVEWRWWVEGLCATNNIGGFGTGERVGLRDLGKRALAYEAMQRRELGR